MRNKMKYQRLPEEEIPKYALSPEQLREVQLKGLEILRYFKKFCEDNQLLFYFCGGCCIGTLRHGGFIPWDDDVDVFMPREDYEKLARLWPQKADTARYSLNRTDESTYTRILPTTIRDNNTTFIRTRQYDLDINQGLMLDVLPLDGCPSGKFARKMQICWALLFSMFNTQEAPTSKGKLLHLVGKALLAVFRTQKARYRVWRFAEKKMSQYKIEDCEYITELCARYQYMVNEYPKEAFESAVYKDFEGEKMPIPKGYDTYLRMAFGDYMQLPPEEAQAPKHEVILCDLEHSYLRYKGQYYCIEEPSDQTD